MPHLPVLCMFAVGMLVGCSAPMTRVILLPDEDGAVGVVSVKTQAGDRALDKAYHYVVAGGLTEEPSPMQEMGAAKVNNEFKNILEAQPAKPLKFLLYFDSGTPRLTEESQAVIPLILEAIKGRGATEVSIIGHADATGTEKVNAKVSLERATAVEQILKDGIPNLNNIELHYYGEKELLIPTPPNTPEPRNRRVEVMIL